MDQIEDVARLRESLLASRRAGASIGLVPTMGALHAGHVALLDACRRENDVVVLSIYVNPSQFGAGEDLLRYPRDIERDRLVADSHGADILFTPSDATMYPEGVDGQIVWVDPSVLAEFMEGRSRPGHFRGVATVVTKLFSMVRPDRAYFGAKDAQQAAVVSRMAHDLALGVDVRVIPTVREADGLALSSRNAFLSSEERRQAAGLKRALDVAQAAFASGQRDAGKLEKTAFDQFSAEAPIARVDYITVASYSTMTPLAGQISEPALVAAAVFFGSTRLIDNIDLGE